MTATIRRIAALGLISLCGLLMVGCDSSPPPAPTNAPPPPANDPGPATAAPTGPARGR